MRAGPLPIVGSGNSVMAPPAVIRATALPANSVNHIAESGPSTTSSGLLFGVGIECLFSVSRVIVLLSVSAIQMPPSGPVVIPLGAKLNPGMNSLGPGVPTRPTSWSVANQSHSSGPTARQYGKASNVHDVMAPLGVIREMAGPYGSIGAMYQRLPSRALTRP